MTLSPKGQDRTSRAKARRSAASNKTDKERKARAKLTARAPAKAARIIAAARAAPKGRRKPDLWQNVPIPRSRDIRLLRPPSLPRGERFETLADAARIDALNIGRLMSTRPDLAAEIERREENGALAPLPISARDARRYRRYDTAERLRIAEMFAGPHQIATVYLNAYPAASLGGADMKLALGALRKKLQRCGFRNVMLIGGTEVAWLAKHGLWILHCHLLAIGVEKSDWDRLRAALPDAGPAAALKVQDLKDLPEQLSYCQKFNSSHKPGRRGPHGRASMYALPPERLIEWAEWISKHRFEEFAFLYGARRHGGRFVPIR